MHRKRFVSMSLRRWLLPVAGVLVLVVASAAPGAAASKRSHRPPAFAAVTRDLDGNGRIDAVDISGKRLRISANNVRVLGYRVRAVTPLRRGSRLLVSERSRADDSARPYVYLRGVRVRATNGTAPVLLAASTRETPGSGHISSVALTLSEPIRSRTLSTLFSVAGYHVQSAQSRGDQVDLRLTPHSSYDTGARPVVSSAGLPGPSGIRGRPVMMTPTDGAPAVLIGATTAARPGASAIDAIVLRFSEPLRVGPGAVQVAGYQVTGTRDYPDGTLVVQLAAGGPGNTAALPSVSLNGTQLRDAGGNPGPSGPVVVTTGASPVMVAARDEGFWLSGEKIVTDWSAPVHATGGGAAGAFSLRGPNGQSIAGATVADGSAPNEIEVSLPLAAETPTQISYIGAGGARVADAAGNLAAPSASTISVTSSQPQLAGTLTDPFNQDQMMPFGQRSFYLQPWRSYSDTFPATRMLGAVGINFNLSRTATYEVSAGAKLLHDAGFTHARIEMPWGTMDYNAPNQIISSQLSQLTNLLQQFKANGIRPLVLLNANDQVPGPVLPTSLTVTAPAPAGATQVQLDSASAARVQPGLTGFNQYGRDAGVIITGVNASGLATLAKPLQTAIAPGTQTGSTLKFQPFFPEYNPDGSPNVTNQATLNGWLQYVAGVTQAVKTILGNDQFDVEVWNELSFGSAFLDASSYYVPAPQGSGDITEEILDATVAYIRSPAANLPDVGIGDGFANQTPFKAGATEPAGVTAIDKHPYAGAIQFPSQATYDGIQPLDALGQPNGRLSNGQWQDTFVPTFTALFPEYYLSGIQTENDVRDLAPFLSDIYGGLHGRFAHPSGGAAPQMWVTEVNEDPAAVNKTLTTADGTATSPMSAADVRHFETKVVLRYLSSWVGKGTAVIDFYAAANAGNFNLIDPGFWTTADQTRGYPGLAAGGETMLAVRRFLDTMAGAQSIGQVRPLSLDAISDYDGAYQFRGNGTAAYPPLYNRDVVGFFPFQVDQHKWVIPSYVMTRDVATLYTPNASPSDVTRQDLPQEVFRETISGVDPGSVRASATDPITGASVPVKIVGRGANSVSVELPLTDYPRLLTLQDG